MNLTERLRKPLEELSELSERLKRLGGSFRHTGNMEMSIAMLDAGLIIDAQVEDIRGSVSADLDDKLGEARESIGATLSTLVQGNTLPAEADS